MSRPCVRYIGSRELHRELPKVLDALEDRDARVVLTVHNRPKAVMIGADAFLALMRGKSPSDKLLAMQLNALVQGLEGHTSGEAPAAVEEPELVGAGA